MESKSETNRSVDLYVRTAELEDCSWVAEHIREADLQEILAYSGSTPKDALVAGFHHSDIPFTVVVGGEPAAIFGASPVEQGVGAVWLLGTDGILKNTTRFLRESRFWLDQCARPYDILFNYVDARNTVHIKWIKWLGFTVINTHKEFGVEKRPFHEFVRIF